MLLLDALYVTIRHVLQEGIIVIRSSTSRTPSSSIAMEVKFEGLRVKHAGKILHDGANRIALDIGEDCLAKFENHLDMNIRVLETHTPELQEEHHFLSE